MTFAQPPTTKPGLGLCVDVAVVHSNLKVSFVKALGYGVAKYGKII